MAAGSQSKGVVSDPPPPACQPLDSTDPVSSLEAREPRPSSGEKHGSEARAAPVGDDEEGECSDGVLTVVDAVLSGRDMLSLRSSDSVGLCRPHTTLQV